MQIKDLFLCVSKYGFYSQEEQDNVNEKGFRPNQLYRQESEALTERLGRGEGWGERLSFRQREDLTERVGFGKGEGEVDEIEGKFMAQLHFI